MAHFAELDENNIVLRVIVVANADTANDDGVEVESIGARFCQNLLGGRWVQTSYNCTFRKKKSQLHWEIIYFKLRYFKEVIQHR